MRMPVFLGVADESYIKGQNGTKLCAAVCTGLAGLESVKNAISKGVCVVSLALSVDQLPLPQGCLSLCSSSQIQDMASECPSSPHPT